MSQIEYGFIAYGGEGFWFEGPLPSPKCARLLAQLHGGIDIDQIPEVVKERLNNKWQLQSPGFASFVARYPDRQKNVKWAIRLEATVREARAIQEGLRLIERLNVEVFNDAGPSFPEIGGDNWSGEDC